MKESHIWWAAFAGILFKDGMTMFKQDMMGLDKYVDYLQLMWVDLHWSVGLGVAAFALYIFYTELKEARKERDHES